VALHGTINRSASHPAAAAHPVTVDLSNPTEPDRVSGAPTQGGGRQAAVCLQYPIYAARHRIAVVYKCNEIKNVPHPPPS